ncbi:ferric reductase-like transmembrane domain-containing protein [Pseudonocardia sp. H11422]|uniref:ferredoxin reductase family protein n=1 Tax=Pseudonocardia sp. H11422 TaxID=2835866 RepID=UPI001BDC8015|nr:ferric reductase-like transmembrane domain-containing protein [Pseudonocardia sp. H11422]
MSRTTAQTGWTAVLLAVLLGPVLVWLPRAEPMGLWRHLSIVTGLLALSALICTAALPSRMRSLTRAFGIENVIGIHRYLGILTAVLIATHLAFVVAADPAKVALLNVFTAPPRAQAAVAASLALAALVPLTARRERLGLPYETWRWLHLVLATAVLGFSALHVWWLEHLVLDAVVGPVLILLGVLLVGVFTMRWVWRSLLDPASEFLVREVRPENLSISTLVLEPRRRAGTAPALQFAPGQFAWLRLERTASEEHPFTIASGAHQHQSVEFTIRHAGDFTEQIRALQPGSSVWVDGPYGSFTADFVTSSGLVLIAGGVGVTPMMSMLRTLAHRRDRRPHRFIVVAGEPADLLFRSELAEMRRQIDLEVTEVLRRPPEGWEGETGGIDGALLAAVLPGDFRRDHLDYFICGPPSLVESALDALDTLGVPAERIHTELFGMV